MSLVRTEQSAHWYSPEGLPMHTMPRKDGSGVRNTTLRDARKLGLLPSVTSILKVWPNPGLDNWKREQDIIAAITTPRLPDETDQEFVARIIEGAGEEAKSAADTGTLFHDAFELRLVSGHWPENNDLKPFFVAWEPWVQDTIVETEAAEIVVVDSAGLYAGRVDWVGRTKLQGCDRAIIDFKNQSVKDGKPRFYDTWAMQLAAYKEAKWRDDDIALISVVLNRDTPEAPHIKVWDESEMNDARRRFFTCVNVWCDFNNYTPPRHE